MSRRPPSPSVANRVLGAALALALAFLGACGGHEDPRAAYVAYLAALGRGDTAAAFELLTPSTRDHLAAVEIRWRSGEPGALVPASPAPEPDDRPPGLALFDEIIGVPGLPGLPRVPEDPGRFVGEARISGRRAQIQIATPLGARDAVLEHEDDGWRVALHFE